MRKKSLISGLLAGFAALTVLMGSAPAAMAQNELLATQTFSFDGYNGSKPLQNNWLEDQKWRTVTVYLPDGYDSNQQYPVVYVLPGFLMYDMENTIDQLVQGPRQAYLQANAPTWVNYTFDMDGIAKRVMTDLNQKFLTVEVNGLTGAGGGLYDCSPAIGDYRSFIRQLVSEIDTRYSTVANKDGRILIGFSMGAYGAVAFSIEYPEVFGGVAYLDPFGNDMDAGPVPGPNGLDPGFVFIYRRILHQYPFSIDLPVHKPVKDSDFAAIQGAAPATPFNDTYFFTQAIWAINMLRAPNQSAQFFGDSLLLDDANRTTSAINYANWENWRSTDTTSRVAAGGGNLSRTIVYLGRGDLAPSSLVLHRTQPDGGLLTAALANKGVTYHEDIVAGRDHYTALGDHPVTGETGTFERALRWILPRLGSQNGNPFSYDSTLATEHASCSVYTPGN